MKFARINALSPLVAESLGVAGHDAAYAAVALAGEEDD